MIEKEFRYTKTVIQTSESSVCASSPVLENVFTSKKGELREHNSFLSPFEKWHNGHYRKDIGYKVIE